MIGVSPRKSNEDPKENEGGGGGAVEDKGGIGIGRG